jgi:hypothetical protein
LNVPKSMDLEAWTSIIQGCRNKIKTFEHTLGKIRGLTVEHRSKDTFSLYTFFPKKGPGSRKGINCLARMEESIVPGMYLPIGSNEDGDILLGLSRISIPLLSSVEERLPYKQVVTGSNPVAPTFLEELWMTHRRLMS